MPKTIKTQINDLLAQATRLALAEVERRARKILREHPNLEEFCMAMGSATFHYRGNNFDCFGVDTCDRDTPKYAQPLARFIEEFDDELKLTGSPMRFTADGPVQTEWGTKNL